MVALFRSFYVFRVESRRKHLASCEKCAKPWDPGSFYIRVLGCLMIHVY